MKGSKLTRFLSSLKVRNYLIIIASVIVLAITFIFAEFGDDKYEWLRDKDGVPIEYHSDTKISKKYVLDILKNVKDPELDINIVDLGLILDINIVNEKILINMILTTPYCPYTSTLIDEIKRTLFKFDKVNSVLLTVKSEPEWSYSRLTEEGKNAVNNFFEGKQNSEH